MAAGAIYTGPFSARPNDSIAFAVGTTHVNTRVAYGQLLQNWTGAGPVPIQNSEYVFEVYYTLVPTHGVYIRPNIQYVHTPGGTSLNGDIIVLGLKTQIFF